MTKEEAVQVAKEIIEEITFEDRSVGITAVGKFSKEVVEEITETFEGIQVLDFSDDSIHFAIGGRNVHVHQEVHHFDTPWGRDCDWEWKIEVQ